MGWDGGRFARRLAARERQCYARFPGSKSHLGDNGIYFQVAVSRMAPSRLCAQSSEARRWSGWLNSPPPHEREKRGKVPSSPPPPAFPMDHKSRTGATEQCRPGVRRGDPPAPRRLRLGRWGAGNQSHLLRYSHPTAVLDTCIRGEQVWSNARLS